MSDVGTNICAPDGPSIDDEGNVYFNTSAGMCINNTGIWKIPDGDAVNAVQVVSDVPPFTIDGTGTVFLTKGSDAGKLLIAGSNNDNTELPEVENIFIADVVSVTGGVPIENPGVFIDLSVGDSPVGVAVNSKGDVFLASNGNNAIWRYSPTGQFLGEFATVTTPLYMEFDMDDNLYITSFSGSGLFNVLKLKQEGEVESFWTVPAASGIAVE